MQQQQGSGLWGQNSGQQLGIKGAEPRAGMRQEGIAEVFHLKLSFELDNPGHCGQKVHLDSIGTMYSNHNIMLPYKFVCFFF